MANKIYNSIRDAFETISHIKLMVGSSEFGRGIGAKKLQLVMENYPDLLEWEYTLENITKLVEIKSIEMITAEKILSNVDGYIDFFDELPQWVKDKFSVTELVSETTTVIEKSNRFEGENVVFSGFRNKEWENIITGEGGKVGSAISGNTTLVVVKDLSSTSQKILKAKEKGIKIIEMKDFII
jgi:NAD-dependent DNA ligase